MKKTVTKITTAVTVLLVCITSARATVWMDWVTIADTANPNDIHGDGYGGVNYIYRIGRYEVTNGQYCELLNAVADVCDPYNLYNLDMGDTGYGGITRTGSEPSYSYSVKPGYGNKPVNHVSWYDCLRFANWLHNGQPTGLQNSNTTEDGAYTFSGQTTVSGRNFDALVWLPSENEWYKAAYYDPDLDGGLGGYWDYATASNDVPDNNTPDNDSGNSANYDYAISGLPRTADVDAYGLSAGAYGTLNQNGNVWEWNEAIIGSNRGARGGSYSSIAGNLPASYRFEEPPSGEGPGLGFRVAAIPCRYVLFGDLNNDCRVDFLDVAYIGANWLVDCDITPNDPECEPIDYDGDGWDWTLDCDEDDPTINPAATEVCDGLDNDCDTYYDEDLTGPLCPYQDGVCTGASHQCGGVSGWSDCNDSTYLAWSADYEPSEITCDGLDNDCDGSADEDLTGPPCLKQQGVCAGSTQPCGGASGWLTCDDGTYSAWNPNYEPSEITCDGLDNDCDGTPDNGNPSTMCPLGANVMTTACSAGTCVITACASGYGDLDGAFSNGCECAPDGYEQNNSCAGSYDLGNELDNDDNDDITVTARLSFDGDVDYYRFYAVDTTPISSVDSFHVRIRFLSNPLNEFKFSVYKDSCSNLVYDGAGTYDDEGEVMHDDSAFYYVRVYRNTGSGQTTCNQYTIKMNNEENP